MSISVLLWDFGDTPRRRALDAPGAERMRDTSIFRRRAANIELSVTFCSL